MTWTVAPKTARKWSTVKGNVQWRQGSGGAGVKMVGDMDSGTKNGLKMEYSQREHAVEKVQEGPAQKWGQVDDMAPT